MSWVVMYGMKEVAGPRRGIPSGVYACAGEIPRNPLLYPKVHGEFRRRLLRRFPYAVYFRIKDDTIIVFGAFHCARDPRAVGTKLRDRNEPKIP